MVLPKLFYPVIPSTAKGFLNGHHMLDDVFDGWKDGRARQEAGKRKTNEGENQDIGTCNSQ